MSLKVVGGSVARRASSSQLKFGRTSPPLWPQAWQVNRDSRSDRGTSSGHVSPLSVAALAIRAIDQETANAAARISPKVIFCWRVSSGMPPMIARAGLGVKPLDIGPFAAWAHYGRVR